MGVFKLYIMLRKIQMVYFTLQARMCPNFEKCRKSLHISGMACIIGMDSFGELLFYMWIAVHQTALERVEKRDKRIPFFEKRLLVKGTQPDVSMTFFVCVWRTLLRRYVSRLAWEKEDLCLK